MKTTSRLGLGLALVALALSLVLYPRLPDPMPSHFDLHGHVDGWMPKPWGAFLLPAIMLGVHALLAGLARRAEAASPRVLEILHVSILGFLLLTHAIVLRVALGGAVDVTRVLFVATGLLLAIIGNYFGKLRRNPWIGIRTPWTLADDEVWARTHRFAAPLFVGGGALIALLALAGRGAPAVVLILVLPLAPLVYSYRLARAR